MIVIDASVGVKLYLDEPGSEEAITLIQQRAHEIAAPDFFAIEVSGALVRQANMGQSGPEATRLALRNFASFLAGDAVRLMRSTSRRIENAAHLSIDLGHPLRDCLYLALAREMDCPLMTCDAKFATKAKGVATDITLLDARGS